MSSSVLNEMHYSLILSDKNFNHHSQNIYEKNEIKFKIYYLLISIQQEISVGIII